MFLNYLVYIFVGTSVVHKTQNSKYILMILTVRNLSKLSGIEILTPCEGINYAMLRSLQENGAFEM